MSDLLTFAWGNRHTLLVFATLLCTLFLKRLRTLQRRSEFSAHAIAQNCQPGRTISAPNLIQRIVHKYRLLFPKSGNAIDNFSQSFQRHGQTFVLERATGVPRTIYTMDRRNSVAILDKMSKDWEIHPNRLAVSKPIAKGGVFFAENHEWLVNRKLGIRNVGFGTKRARNAESLESDVEMLFEAIGDAGEDGWTECVDLADLLYRATGDMISHQLLGVRANTQLEYINEKVDGTQGATSDQVRMNAEKAYILHMLGKRSKMGQWNFLGDGLKFRAACRNFKRSVDGIIQQALDRSHAASLDQADAVDIAQNSLISGLANSTADAQRIRDVVVDMLVAGEQASGTVLAFLVANLERQPELFNDVRKEILDTFGTEQNPKGVINWDRLKSCNLLQWCILEALRLFGPVGVIARQSRRDTVLPHGGGPDGEAPLAVPRGAGVIIFTSLIHQRVDYWGEDAETFKPRRWEERKFGSEWAAFGQGARLCIGQQISMTQMSYVFARLLQHYSSLEAPDPGDNLRKAFGFVVTPKHGVRLRLRREMPCA